MAVASRACSWRTARRASRGVGGASASSGASRTSSVTCPARGHGRGGARGKHATARSAAVKAKAATATRGRGQRAATVTAMGKTRRDGRGAAAREVLREIRLERRANRWHTGRERHRRVAEEARAPPDGSSRGRDDDDRRPDAGAGRHPVREAKQHGAVDRPLTRPPAPSARKGTRVGGDAARPVGASRRRGAPTPSGGRRAAGASRSWPTPTASLPDARLDKPQGAPRVRRSSPGNTRANRAPNANHWAAPQYRAPSPRRSPMRNGSPATPTAPRTASTPRAAGSRTRLAPFRAAFSGRSSRRGSRAMTLPRPHRRHPPSR